MKTFKEFLLERRQIGDEVQQKAIELLGSDEFVSTPNVRDDWIDLAKQEQNIRVQSAVGAWQLELLKYKEQKFVRIIPPKGTGKTMYLVAEH